MPRTRFLSPDNAHLDKRLRHRTCAAVAVHIVMCHKDENITFQRAVAFETKRAPRIQLFFSSSRFSFPEHSRMIEDSTLAQREVSIKMRSAKVVVIGVHCLLQEQVS